MGILKKGKSLQNKKSYLTKIVFLTIFFLLFFGTIFLINKKFNLSEKLKTLFIIAIEKDIFVKRLYLINYRYDSFKKQIKNQTKGSSDFCERFPETKKIIEEVAKTRENLDFGIQPNGILAMSSLGPDTVIAMFNYCRDKNDIYGFAYAIIKFDSDNNFKIVKVIENKSFGSAWYYGEWIKLEKEFGKANFTSRNIMRNSSLLKLSGFRIVKSYNYDYVETYFNPFLLGLNEEKPYQDNFIFFGLYKNKPVLFFTNEYLRFRLKLNENQGMATDFDGQEHFVSFKDLTNQIVLHGKTEDSKDMYFDIKIRSVSDIEYQFSAPFIDVDNGNYFVISEEVTVDFSNQRETDFKAIWINSQLEITNKIIEDYKQYLLDKQKLDNLVSFRYKN